MLKIGRKLIFKGISRCEIGQSDSHIQNYAILPFSRFRRRAGTSLWRCISAGGCGWYPPDLASTTRCRFASNQGFGTLLCSITKAGPTEILAGTMKGEITIVAHADGKNLVVKERCKWNHDKINAIALITMYLLRQARMWKYPTILPANVYIPFNMKVRVS